jgi:serine phosphatase RsbU (regulator of sigma subunit)
MFFRRKKTGGEAPEASRPALAAGGGDGPGAAAAGAGGGGSDETEFLTGDALQDRRSVESLLDEIARISERVARVSGPKDLRELLTYIVDASIERTGAERGLLLLAREGGEGDADQEVHVARQRGGRDIGGDVRYSTSAVKRVLETGQPLKDMFNSAAEAMDLGASVFDLKLRALMAVPLAASPAGAGQRRGVRGVLYVDSKAATREFTGKDLSYFNALSRQIAVALESARLHLDSLERARLEESLETASVVQGNLMPQVPRDFPGFELFGWYRAAERTSGDFYDFFRTKSRDLGVVIGDVTGHGPASALITSTAQASLRSIMRVLDDPREALVMLNQDLAERMDTGLFVTLFLAVLGEDGVVRGLNAGHTPPLLWHAKDGSVEVIGGNGPALGMIDDFQYDAATPIAMEVGDVLIAYTDGLTEARAPEAKDDLYGEERLRAALAKQAAASQDARALTEALVAEVLEFARGEREDDMTLVTVRRTAGAGS